MVMEYHRMCHEDSAFTFLGPALPPERLSHLLYSMNFGKDFLDRCTYTYDWDFSAILRSLHSGTFWQESNATQDSQVRQQQYLVAFAVALCSLLQNQPQLAGPGSARIHDSLADDGFRYVDGRLLPIVQQVVSENEEFSAVQHLLSIVNLSSKVTIATHYESGQKQYAQGEFHACVGEWRSFIEALLRGIWIATKKHRPEFTSHSETPPMKDVFEFLGKSGFFTPDERLAFSSVWGFLSAGGHPGIPAKEDAHLSMFIALTFGHAALLKLESWQTNNYLKF